MKAPWVLMSRWRHQSFMVMKLQYYSKIPYIAGNFRGGGVKHLWFNFSHFVDNTFVVATCTAGKGRQGLFIRG